MCIIIWHQLERSQNISIYSKERIFQSLCRCQDLRTRTSCSSKTLGVWLSSAQTATKAAQRAAWSSMLTASAQRAATDRAEIEKRCARSKKREGRDKIWVRWQTAPSQLKSHPYLQQPRILHCFLTHYINHDFGMILYFFPGVLRKPQWFSQPFELKNLPWICQTFRCGAIWCWSAALVWAMEPAHSAPLETLTCQASIGTTWTLRRTATTATTITRPLLIWWSVDSSTDNINNNNTFTNSIISGYQYCLVDAFALIFLCAWNRYRAFEESEPVKEQLFKELGCYCKKAALCDSQALQIFVGWNSAPQQKAIPDYSVYIFMMWMLRFPG